MQKYYISMLNGDFYLAFEVDAALAAKDQEIEHLKSVAMKAAAGMAGAIHRSEDLEASLESGLKVLREDCEISAARAEKFEAANIGLKQELAAKDARIAELEKLITQLTATGESLCVRLDQVHLMASTPAPFSHSKAILGEIADLTIGYGPAESHKVVE